MSKPADDEANIDLNPPALRPASDAPWRDDTLQRRAIAAELSTLARQLAQGSESAAIALDGGYGTGKTFILERWVAEMQKEGQVAVYYNAWENDCDDDPLVSLVETLVANDKTDWAKTARASLNEALAGLAHKFTGIDQRNMSLVAKSETGGLLEAAAARRSSRQKLKEQLAELVDGAKETSLGVVVVIDELDRCRPTFAAELMERVKHVLNVPGLVFVFGVNMVSLRETVKAAYGDIDAHQYLLRMFATTLRMPSGVVFRGPRDDDHLRTYLRGLADRHGLHDFCAKHGMLQENLGYALQLLECVMTAGGLTPREMERVMWLLAKVASSSLQSDGRASAMLPLVLVPLAVSRVKNPEAYYETVLVPDRATAALDCFFALIQEYDCSEWESDNFDRMEVTMYRMCHQHPPSDYNSIPPALAALKRFADEEGATELDGQHLSRRSQHITKERAQALWKADQGETVFEISAHWRMHLTLGFGALRELTSRFDVVWPKGQTR